MSVVNNFYGSAVFQHFYCNSDQNDPANDSSEGTANLLLSPATSLASGTAELVASADSTTASTEGTAGPAATAVTTETDAGAAAETTTDTMARGMNWRAYIQSFGAMTLILGFVAYIAGSVSSAIVFGAIGSLVLALAKAFRYLARS